ncbi:hypothetical protein JHJ32_21490 [Parapedobacter sp. ISTM3]|uniref:hypothetical protein n=1 Tax=Parapedobacter sp. ISTM3 TaxID=2800130 RepID=UPI0019088E49|nr:hypothetical protein [Parapedobacter sp. ISTM3]MBK1442588.1 hypothetical protein [Parapedobacter sp. ISTM3]
MGQRSSYERNGLFGTKRCGVVLGLLMPLPGWPLGGGTHLSMHMITSITQLITLLREAVNLLREIVAALHKLLAVLLLIARQGVDNPQLAEIAKPDTLHDAKYAAERIGVVDKTLSRLIKKGLLPIHSYVNRKRQFLESDIERCRRFYRDE